MRTVSRRGFFKASGAALGALPLVRSIDALAQVTNPVFRHGVASGDPLSDRVILWTRVTPRDVTVEQTVRWVVARDEKLSQTVARGDARTGAARDFTVKLDARGLESGTTYYYRFESAGEQSDIGRTRTLPRNDVARVRLGVVSCSNMPQGYFNAYACLGARRDLDAVLHLGDYFYEYANAQYGDGSRLGRAPAPDKELMALQDYRERHAQYKADPDLQAIHRHHPFIVVWDDHEFANNTWRGGAQNHNPDQGEGEWVSRRSAALQAYLEWMPIREDAPALQGRIYRAFRFGNLATLIMLDTRAVGRDEQVARKDTALIESTTRQLLGVEQEGWLAEQFVASVRTRSTWTVLGQQVMFAPQTPTGALAGNADSWDGYRGARARVFDMIERAKLNNLAVLTGDVHSSWAFDLPRDPFGGYDKATGKGSLGVEFAGTSVTSPSNVGRDGIKQLDDLKAARPHLHYVDGRYRGYYVVDLTRQRLQTDYYAMATIEERSTQERFEKGFITESGTNHLVEVSTPA
ncbi:MAG TPA: alkaline phosphatase D family protein [Vicinamibacterales bacterium]|nr:alkaline phosphatase D family protein [Vicinamibacterales bacterium]